MALFDACLQVQEAQLAKQEEAVASRPADDADEGAAERAGINDADGDVDVDGLAQQEDQWFSIVEPITIASLLDTLNAALSAIAALCHLDRLERPQSTEQLEAMAAAIVTAKLDQYMQSASDDERAEAWQAKAEVSSAILEAKFREGKIDVGTYDGQLKRLFDAVEVDMRQVRSPVRQCSTPDSTITPVLTFAARPEVDSNTRACRCAGRFQSSSAHSRTIDTPMESAYECGGPAHPSIQDSRVGECGRSST